MNRRNAIKNLTLGIGYVVSVPAVVGIMQSCEKENVSWDAVFLTDEEQNLVTHLADLILPTSEYPGGLEMNLPQFIDRMCADLLNEADKKHFAAGSKQFSESLKTAKGKSLLKASSDDIEEVFAGFFDISSEEHEKIIGNHKKSIEELPEQEAETYALYKCLFSIREFALLGYFTSENIGTEVLNFDPIPGGYKPCIPVSEVGNAWTIG